MQRLFFKYLFTIFLGRDAKISWKKFGRDAREETFGSDATEVLTWQNAVVNLDAATSEEHAAATATTTVTAAFCKPRKF